MIASEKLPIKTGIDKKLFQIDQISIDSPSSFSI